MAIYEFARDSIVRLDEITFGAFGLQERNDLQRLLRDNIEVIAQDTLVISEEFGDWEDSRRRIDLLAIDKTGALVVVELKRTEDGGHMDLQAIRYASMVSTMTFEKAAEVFGQYLKQIGKDALDARTAMLDFLEWDTPDEDAFAQDVKIVLASAEFSKELTSSVLWLIDHDIDIRCIRLKPYSYDGRLLVDVQQIIPPPEAAAYQVQIREKNRKEREARTSNIDFTRFDIQFGDRREKAMWKRNAVFLVCKLLCSNGVDPERIAALIDWRPNRVWFSVGDVVDAHEFKVRANAKATSLGQGFSPNRWFCEQEDLINANGKTYAFSNQWGGESWHRAMNLLKDTFPDFDIRFVPTSSTE